MRVRGASGQAAPLAAALVAMGVVLTIALGTLAGDVVDVARARTAADAAALAGVEGGLPAASRLAAHHDAAIVSWARVEHGGAVTVTVTVRVGVAVATARAAGGEAVDLAGWRRAPVREGPLPTLVDREPEQARRGDDGARRRTLDQR